MMWVGGWEIYPLVSWYIRKYVHIHVYRYSTCACVYVEKEKDRLGNGEDYMNEYYADLSS